MLFFLNRLLFLAGVKKPEHDGILAGDWNSWYNAWVFLFTNTALAGLELNFLFSTAASIIVVLFVTELGTQFLDTSNVHVSR